MAITDYVGLTLWKKKGGNFKYNWRINVVVLRKGCRWLILIDSRKPFRFLEKKNSVLKVVLKK